MINYWYVSRNNEILIDMDKPESSLPHAEARLAGAIAYGKLAVKRVEIHPSQNSSHLHSIITLRENLEPMVRVIWAQLLHSDIYRSIATAMRIVNGISCPDLLITPTPFSRFADADCQCDSKHDAKTMNVCPIAIKLRGEERTVSFFGRPVYTSIIRLFDVDRTQRFLGEQFEKEMNEIRRKHDIPLL